MTPDDVAALLVGHRFFWTNEYDLQDGIERALTGAGVEVERERRLGAAGRIDMFLPLLRIGVEVKVKGAVPPLLRQLGRYANHPDVEGLVVASTAARHRSIPADIFGVPVAVAPLIGDLL